MSVFTVDLANQPGELARLCEAMAGRGINLVLSAIARGDGGTVAFIADDEASAQEVLGGAGLQFAMRPALTIRMENQPGTGAATFRKLADAGVNADLLLPVRVSDALFFAVICVDDQDRARQALGAQVILPGSRPVALAAVPGPGPGRSPPLPRSQRHRSYPRDQTTRPAVIPAPGLASTPDGNGSPDSSHRQSQSARRIRSSPPCRFGTAIWHADNGYRLVQIGLICAHAGMTFATTSAQCGHLVTRACDRGGGEHEMQPVPSRAVARVIVSHGVSWLIRRGGPHGRLSALRRRPAAEERLRIARDVHDLVGHGLSAIAVQSGTARLALDAGRIETARTALAAVESGSRAALGEMRQLLGVLRAGDAGEHGRLPGLGDLPGLAGGMGRQGVMVTLHAGELGAVPGAVSVAAYRVVQEALTNVVKHAGGSRVTVEVGASGDAVLVTVEDYAGPAAPQAGAGHPAGEPPGGRAGGAGLAGMRERVAGFGGEVSAGPAGDHPGWRVRARIPYAQEDAG